jgi:hypothetical protein
MILQTVGKCGMRLLARWPLASYIKIGHKNFILRSLSDIMIYANNC